jgi:hypothetical protein
MQAVVREWKHSAEVNMSNIGCNRQAWLGQAACCYATGAPDFVTKMAWRSLTDEQRAAANQAADNVIKEWDKEHGEHANQTNLFEG